MLDRSEYWKWVLSLYIVLFSLFFSLFFQSLYLLLDRSEYWKWVLDVYTAKVNAGSASCLLH